MRTPPTPPIPSTMLPSTTHFNSPNADLILRTCDGLELRVFSCILAEASPFFSDMLSLPQPPRQSNTPVGPPVVDVSECGKVMDTLLQFVYPIPDPIIRDLEELPPVLSTALKYDFTTALSTLRTLLVSPRFVESTPTRVYAIACSLDLEEEAKIASSYTLRTPLLDYSLPDELKFITAYDYCRLLKLHRSRAQAAQALLVLEPGVMCSSCSAVHYGHPCAPKWWSDFETRARAELTTHPITDTIFSMSFLCASANAGCSRCGTSMFEAHDFLARLKQSIDALPSTI